MGRTCPGGRGASGPGASASHRAQGRSRARGRGASRSTEHPAPSAAWSDARHPPRGRLRLAPGSPCGTPRDAHRSGVANPCPGLPVHELPPAERAALRAGHRERARPDGLPRGRADGHRHAPRLPGSHERCTAQATPGRGPLPDPRGRSSAANHRRGRAVARPNERDPDLPRYAPARSPRLLRLSARNEPRDRPLRRRGAALHECL